jgi:hypothetical protein
MSVDSSSTIIASVTAVISSFSVDYPEGHPPRAGKQNPSRISTKLIGFAPFAIVPRDRRRLPKITALARRGVAHVKAASRRRRRAGLCRWSWSSKSNRRNE